jgi:uncharacterized protein (DUF302 family)
MKKIILSLGVSDASDACKQFLTEQGFTLFGDIDHQENAGQVGMMLPAARSLIFGKPEAGTRLMQQDICAAFDLPLRLAVVENEADRNTSVLMLPEGRDFASRYALDETHPVLQAIDALIGALIKKLDGEN